MISAAQALTQPFKRARSGAICFPRDNTVYRQGLQGMSVPPPPEVIFVDTPQVACDGDEGPLGHPRVYLKFGASGKVECGYCDRLYILKGGPSDDRQKAA